MARKPSMRKTRVRATWHERARASASRHPVASASAIAAGVVALVVTVAQMRPAIEWVTDHVQTPAQTKRDLDDLRREVQRADDVLAREAKEHGKADDRKAAWSAYGIADLKVTILRNRLRDCSEKKRAFVGGAALALNCEDYEREYNEAYERAKEIYKAALETSK